MIVLKFGGTSVENSSRLRTSTGIVANQRDRSPIVVVSALAGVTDDLVEAIRLAGESNLRGATTIVERIRSRHEEIAFDLVQQKSDFLEAFNAQLSTRVDELNSILAHVSSVGQIEAREHDQIVALGEKLSSVLFAYTLRLRTLNGVHVDSEDVIVTNDRFGSAEPDMNETRAAAEQRLLPEIQMGRIPVLGGFFGRSKSGATATLGRGGSDYSAAIVSAAIDAEEIQIWTDVDGMMTADPRLVDSAKPVEILSYDEASELARCGAKVLHPDTVRPAVKGRIPIRILNTHDPSAAGTLITAEGSSSSQPRAISLRKGLTCLEVRSDATELAAAVFGSIEKHHISPQHVSTTASRVTMAFDRHEDALAISDSLSKAAESHIIESQTSLTIVGRDLSVIQTRLAAIVERSDVTMTSFGESGLSYSLVVSEESSLPLLATIHRELFEEIEEQVS